MLLSVLGLTACSLDAPYKELDGERDALYHWGVFSYVTVKGEHETCRGRVKNLGVADGNASGTVRLRCTGGGQGQIVWERAVGAIPHPNQFSGTLKGEAVSFVLVEPDCKVWSNKFRCE